MLDIKIINGTIVDGTGRPGYRGDVGIKEGRIVALGEVGAEAQRTIDATGKIVSPGFIDVHTHYDAQVFWDPALTPSSNHGVTTILGGFCGFSIAPLAPDAGEYLMHMLSHVEGMPIATLASGVPWDWSSFGSYLAKIEGNVAVNAGFCAGHSAIRRWVMGERAVGHHATDAEIDAMKDLLRESIEQGALGFSSSVSATHNDGDAAPVPSRHASREELLALASVCSEYEGTIAELIPGANFNDETYQLLTDFSLSAKRPVNWNAVGVQAPTPETLASNAYKLGATDHARAQGAEVIALTVPVSATVRMNLASGFIFDALTGWPELFKLPLQERMEKLRDPAYRAHLLTEGQKDVGAMAFVFKYDRMRIDETFSAETKLYQGRSVGEVARELGKDPFDTLIDIALADDLKTSFMPQLAVETRETYLERAKLWRDDRTVVGASDAGAHVDSIDTFAFSTGLLQKGVREHGVISLEEAVQQMTQKAAALYGLKERGELKAGYCADIVVFDLATVGSGPTYTRFDLPAGAGRLYADAYGIEHVIVNGAPIIRDGVSTGATPGAVLRPGIATRTITIPSAA